MEHRVAQVQQDGIRLRAEHGSAFRLVQKERGVKDDGGERTDGRTLPLQPKGVVNQGLPSWRDRGRQPHTPFRIRAVEPRITESRRQCDFKGLLERFGRQVNVAPKLDEMLGVFFAVGFV